MNYFNLNNNIKKKDWINLRKKSQNINQDNFKRGDIITLTFWNKCYNYYFEGLYIGLKKSFNNVNLIIWLKNILQNVTIECIGPYYLNRFFLKTFISNYKRKQLWYKKSKLYYLCEKENKASKVKE